MAGRQIDIETSAHAQSQALTEEDVDVDNPTSPLSPISPWPPVPSPPRTRGRKRRQSSSHSRLGITATTAAAPGDAENGGRGSVTHSPNVGEDDDEEIDDEYEIKAEQTSETLPSAPEVYGALAALLMYIAFAVYLVWGFAPEGWLDQWGWTWYPDREWAIVMPCYLMVILLLTYLSYAALTAWNTPAFDSLSLITDKYANMPPRIQGQAPYYHKYAAVDAIPEAVDLPIDLVCRVLYPPRPRPGAGS